MQDESRFGPWATAQELEAALRETGYVTDPGLATVTWLAANMQRPLLLEGEPGTGKTALAQALAQARGTELIRLQCYEGIDASQALYDWDFAKQILHLRTIEVLSGADGSAAAASGSDATQVGAITDQLYSQRFLIDRPVLRALRTRGSVLLIDEVDRADDEFEAFLLEVLSTFAVTIPELGPVHAEEPPLVILTSNRTRDVHDALKRRCLYHWLEHPSLDREVQIIRTRRPEVAEPLARQVASVIGRLRGSFDAAEAPLLKPPGVAESLDWASALHALGHEGLDLEAAAATLGVICKYREDSERVRDALDRLLTPG